jgi:hypothetical protein
MTDKTKEEIEEKYQRQCSHGKMCHWKNCPECREYIIRLEIKDICQETIKQTRQETIKECIDILDNWADFTCHTRNEHKTIANDCPGWSHEDSRVRKILLLQIKTQLQLLTE